MARKLRLEYPGASYHVINRGNYRVDVFRAGSGLPSSDRNCFNRTLHDPSRESRHPAAPLLAKLVKV